MSSTIAYLRNRKYTGLNDIEKIKNDFYQVHVTVSYDREIVNGKRRIIFTANKGMRSQKFDKIIYECNGLVLEAPTWNPLVVPCPTPKTSVNNVIVNKLLNQNNYSIYKVSDGTVIYLYFWNDSWHISTARGLDVLAIKFNDKTYLELMNEVLAKYETNYQEFTNSLNKNSSYSFVLRHNSIHQFAQEEDNCLIFIHKIEINNGHIEFIRTTHELPYKIQYQEEIAGEIKLQELYSNLSTSLSNWLNTKKDPLFGYMLISNAPYKVGGDHSCILFKSSLVLQIERFLYDKKFMEYGKDRSVAVIVNGFLGSNNKIFTEILPQYKPEFERLTAIQEKLVSDILDNMVKMDKSIINGNNIKTGCDAPGNNNQTVCVSPNNNGDNDKLNNLESIPNNHVQYFTELVKNKLKSTINLVDVENTKSHIKGIINNTKFTKIYISLSK